VRTEPRTIFITEGLERHRQRDHLSEEIIEADDGPAIRAGLEILSETHPVLREPLLPFGIGRPTAERLEHQAVGLAKRMRIALAAPTALETHFAGERPVDHDVVRNARGLQPELERRLDDDRIAVDRLVPHAPPRGRDLELEGGRPVGESLDLDAEIGHGGRPDGSVEEERKARKFRDLGYRRGGFRDARRGIAETPRPDQEKALKRHGTP